MFQITTSSHPSADLSRPSIILTSEGTGKKYLFGNIPEGCQRIINENKLGLNKIDEIFLTGKIDWSSIGGLPGLILTSLDQGRTFLKLNYCGSDKFLKYLISCWRYFIFRFGLNLTLNEFNNGDTIDLSKQSGFKVVPVSISNPRESQVPSSTKLYESLSKLVTKVFPTQSSDVFIGKDMLSTIALPDITTRSSQSCNYIINFNSIRGKFITSKLILLGVPKGPLFAKLTQGQTVTLPNGDNVTPDQVMEPQRDFGKVLVLDIPDKDYLESTLSYNWGDEVQIIYHFLGDEFDVELLQAPEYLQFFKKFDDAQHFISHSKICSNSINFHSSALLTLKLKSINNELFRLPQSGLNPKVPLGENVYILNSLQNITIRPNNDLQYDSENANTTSEDYWDKLYDDHITPLDLKFHSKNEVLAPAISNFELDDIEILTLGTGSALPSKYRNVISTILRIPQKGFFNSIVLDAGENTIGSMKRLFNKDEFVKFFQDELSLIYLSHLHADHHLGIISLIKNFNKYNINNRKLHIVCPWQYDLFLKEWFKFNNNLDELSNIVYLSCEFFEVNKKLSSFKQHPFNKIDNLSKLPRLYQDLTIPGNLESVLQEIGISKIETCKAIHCDWAYSVSITFTQNNFKISYSGDTRPSLQFVKIGANSNLLIHESTLEDELILDLIDKRHTTILELKYLLKLMNVDKLVLTHFSQRYPRLPNLNDDDDGNEVIANCLKVDKFSIFKNKPNGQLAKDNIIYAFDNMWFKYGDIHLQYEKFNGLDLSFLEKLIVEEEVEVNDRKRGSDEL